LEERIQRIISVFGEQGECQNCGETIFWCKTKKGSNIPMNPGGQTHFVTCKHKLAQP